MNINKPVNHKYTDNMLKKELDDAIAYVEPEAFVEHIFPDHFLPWNIDDVFYRLSRVQFIDKNFQYHIVGKNTTGKWICVPNLDVWSAKTGKCERQFAVFLDEIINAARSVHVVRGNGVALRDLTAEFSSLPLFSQADGMLRKPDILGIDADLLSLSPQENY